MKIEVDLINWNRKQVYDYFIALADPTFSLVVNIDVTKAYKNYKNSKIPFFVKYLHACLTGVNSVENFRYRIEKEKVFLYDMIHVSSTVTRPDNSFGLSFVEYNKDLIKFAMNYKSEYERIQGSTDFLPPKYEPNCIYSSALPWLTFTSHKYPSNLDPMDSISKLSFGKFFEQDEKILMPIGVDVNHALIDGFHVGQFFDVFQNELNKNV